MRVVLSLLSLCLILGAQQPQIDEATRDWMITSVAAHRAAGIAAGAITKEGQTFVAHGAVAQGGTRPGEDTVFEIGSIT